MTMTELPTPLYYPEMFVGTTATFNLTSATNRHYSYQQVPVSGMLQKVLLPISGGDGTTSVRLRIDTVNPTNAAFQTNTLLAPGAEAVITGVVPGTYEVTLDTPVAVTKGQAIAVRLTVETFGTVVNTTRSAVYAVANYNGLPFLASTTSATGAPSRTTGALPTSSLMIDGVWRYQLNIIPLAAATFASLTTTSNPSEVGARIVMPFAARVAGYWWGYPSGAGTTVAATLYGEDGDVVLKTENPPPNGGTSGPGEFRYSDPIDFAAGDIVRFGIQALSSSVAVRSVSVARAEYMPLMPGRGKVILAQRSPATGDWTDDPLSVPAAGLVFSHIDTGGDGGSGTPPASNRKVKIGGAFVPA